MWISQQISKGNEQSESQTGKSTLNSNGSVEITSTGVSRDVELYAPYGYSFSLPVGQSVLLTRCDGAQAGLGVAFSSEALALGEIKITSSSGAYIYLKQDGSVEINGLKINKNGVIE